MPRNQILLARTYFLCEDTPIHFSELALRISGLTKNSIDLKNPQLLTYKTLLYRACVNVINKQKLSLLIYMVDA